MTREDVLSGVKFKWNCGVYTVHPDDRGEAYGGHISSYMRYECNVSSFGPYAMHWYTFIMGRRVNGRISYKHLEPHIEAPQAVAA